MADIPEKTEPGPLKPVDDWEWVIQVEYDAWLDFMAQFYRATGATEEEVNEKGGPWDGVFIALRKWSERLAQLRRPQAAILKFDERGFPEVREPTARELALKQVAEVAREREDRFQEEHGVSSAEYYHESGYSDRDSERRMLEEQEED